MQYGVYIYNINIDIIALTVIYIHMYAGWRFDACEMHHATCTHLCQGLAASRAKGGGITINLNIIINININMYKSTMRAGRSWGTGAVDGDMHLPIYYKQLSWVGSCPLASDSQPWERPSECIVSA